MAVRARDLGMARIRRELARGAVSTHVGLVGSRAQQPHRDAKGFTVAELGALHEYGSSDGAIPARRFLRTAAPSIAKAQAEVFRRELPRFLEAKTTLVDAARKAGMAGAVAAREVFDRADEWARPLAETTIEAKGHDQPLRESGQLRSALGYRVRHHGQFAGEGYP